MDFRILLWIVFTTISTSFRDDYTAESNKDRIKSLPGLSDKTFKKYSMFSGYIDLFESSDRSIFYWFVESLNDPKVCSIIIIAICFVSIPVIFWLMNESVQNDPVTVWTNGGPGASGLTGMFLSLGPFRPMKNGTLRVQPFSWVNVASIIFIEQPAGTGFSIDKTNATNNDNSTARDNYNFIHQWLKKFPNYQSNDMYIASESYGGHYMPMLAQKIVEENSKGKEPKIHLKGIFVNNPFTDPVENQRGHYETLYGHQVISKPAYEEWKEACHYGADNANVTQECHDAQSNIFHALAGPINVQALDYPICTDTFRNDEVYLFYKHRASSGAVVPPQYAKMIRHFEEHPDEKWYHDSEVEELNLGMGSLPEIDGFEYDPCEAGYLDTYLNQKSVQEAIHAIPQEWPGPIVHYSPDNPHATGIQPIWQWLLDNDPSLHLTIVSGDDDSVVGTFGTQFWMWEMGWEVDVNNTWKMWMTEEGQAGGWLTKFKKGVNLLTIHSGGHMVATTQPSRSLQAFQRYLKGEF